ncbi:MAG TPA: ATP-binding protein, partial [Vicinamibacterales bacterium]|nr:ATP-binding protein [Vicinamibacterales bacterium]
MRADDDQEPTPEQRLVVLLASSASILNSPNVDAVVASTIALARDVFSSDGYALWRVDNDGVWRMVQSVGISPAFAARVITLASNQPAPRTVPFEQPLIVEDVLTAPMVSDMRDAYLQEGVSSMIVFPLRIRGERRGTLVFYSRSRTHYRKFDVQVGAAVANLAAASLTTAELYEEQRSAREASDHARERATFLAEASTALSASLDYEATLRSVAQLAVPTIADWCAVDILNDAGDLERLAVAHVDPGKVELARTLQERYPPDPDAPGGVHQVIRTASAVLVPRIPPALLEAAARDEEHRRIIRELSLTSYMCVPMIAHGKAFGAITFVSAESGREYSDGDLPLAKEVASRASLAVENARAYALANETSRVKDEFLSTLSHELRTPLGSVLTYARMLRSGMVQPAELQHVFDVIERNATSLKKIVEDVLDVSSIVAGRIRLDVQEVDLPTVLRESCATVMPAANAKGIRIEVVIDPMSSSVSGDPSRLQQIVWNLLSNAIKFTPRGGKVQLRLARVNSHVEITVSDTGIGITPEFLPFVFEKFRQADGTFSRQYGGLGLGLAIAKQLAELHGGTILARSAGPGHGATFVLSLPLMIVHAPPAAVREQPRTDRAPTLDAPPSLDGLTLLAVDDDPDSLNVMRTVLAGAGATVITAHSGASALEILQQRTPDVIITDIGMPGMDGFQLIRAIRQMHDALRRTPAVALTAYARSQDRVTALASGFQMHLVKPV